MRALVGLAALFLAIVICSACGYRSLHRTLATLPRSACIDPVDVSRISESRFAIDYSIELARELRRRRVALQPARRGKTSCFRGRVLALEEAEIALSGRYVAASVLVLRMEAALGPEGGPSWRSGLIELRERVWQSTDILRSESLRKLAIKRLAQRSATEVVSRWVSSAAR